MREVVAPKKYELNGERSLFLAGSIEMGAAIDWQREVVECLVDEDVTLLNPRRSDWDSSWVQNINHPQFREQVEWELEALERADKVLLFLAPGTKSPISLLELGLFGKKTVVCCPDGFWRRGNVEIVCKRYGIPFTETLEDALNLVAYEGRCG